MLKEAPGENSDSTNAYIAAMVNEGWLLGLPCLDWRPREGMNTVILGKSDKQDVLWDNAVTEWKEGGRQRGAKALRDYSLISSIPSPLHNPERFWLRMRSLTDLWDQIVPILYCTDIPEGIIPGQMAQWQKVDLLQQSEYFQSEHAAIELLRQLYPSAIDYQRARQKAFHNWTNIYPWSPTYQLDRREWQQVSEENGEQLFGKKHWRAAMQYVALEAMPEKVAVMK